MKKVWLEVALNGGGTRRWQPKMPTTIPQMVEDALACAEAGAAILHLHAYDAEGVEQENSTETYVRIAEEIRRFSDAIVYPTTLSEATLERLRKGSGGERYAHVQALAAKDLLEWMCVDPGSTNISLIENLKAGQNGSVYTNKDSDIREGLAIARHLKAHPSFALYEPGFARTGATLAHPGAPRPIYRLMLSDSYTFGFPAREYAVEAWARLLAEVAPGAPWMVAGLGVDVLPLVGATVKRGGHVRVGLEDAPKASQWTNLQWTREAAARIADAGGALASPDDVRADLERG